MNNLERLRANGKKVSFFSTIGYMDTLDHCTEAALRLVRHTLKNPLLLQVQEERKDSMKVTKVRRI